MKIKLHQLESNLKDMGFSGDYFKNVLQRMPFSLCLHGQSCSKIIFNPTFINDGLLRINCRTHLQIRKKAKYKGQGLSQYKVICLQVIKKKLFVYNVRERERERDKKSYLSLMLSKKKRKKLFRFNRCAGCTFSSLGKISLDINFLNYEKKNTLRKRNVCQMGQKT